MSDCEIDPDRPCDSSSKKKDRYTLAELRAIFTRCGLDIPRKPTIRNMCSIYRRGIEWKKIGPSETHRLRPFFRDAIRRYRESRVREWSSQMISYTSFSIHKSVRGITRLVTRDTYETTSRRLRIRERYHSREKKRPVDHPSSYLSNCTSISETWIRKQQEYIRHLSGIDKAIVLSYSHGGDRIIQAFYLNDRQISPTVVSHLMTSMSSFRSYVFPLSLCLYEFIRDKSYEEFAPYLRPNTFVKNSGLWEQMKDPKKFYEASLTFFSNVQQRFLYCSDHLLTLLLTEYGKRLDTILANAPRTETTMFVWRGIRKDDFMMFHKDLFRNRLLMSSTLSVRSAVRFTAEAENCCLYRIVVLPGSHCLCNFMLSYYRQEQEVLFPPGRVLYRNGEAFVPQNSTLKTYNLVLI